MKGLKKIPSQRQILQAYKTLQFMPDSVSIKNLVLWSQWTRLDPRLGEILVAYLADFWQKHKPLEINRELKKQIWPAVFGVLLEQVPFCRSQNLYRSDFKFHDSHRPNSRERGSSGLPEASLNRAHNHKKQKPENSNRTGKQKKEREDFFYWAKSAMLDISPANDELFFIGLYKTAGKFAKEECFYSIKPYRKWGYFSKELLINKAGQVAPV